MFLFVWYASLPLSGSNQHVISEYVYIAMNTELINISKVALNHLAGALRLLQPLKTGFIQQAQQQIC